MSESLFERITTSDVSQALMLLALIAFGAAIAVLLAVALSRQRRWRWAVFGLLVAVSVALLWLGWELVVARTTFHDRLYRDAKERRKLDALFPPAERYEARERARYSPTDPMLREGLPAASSTTPAGRVWLPPDRLDSVTNLAVLAVVFAGAGLGVGLVWGWAMRRWRPAPAEGNAEP